MESNIECRIPLLWNANGCVEVIQQDNVSPEEARKFIKLVEGEDLPERECLTELDLDAPLPKSCVPSPSPSVELNSEGEYQERLSLLEENPNNAHNFSICNISYCIDKHDKVVPAARIIHKTERVYSCHLCAKKFSRKFNLNTHIKCVHSDDKDYVCPFCERAFNHSSNLRKHIKTVHGDEKRMPCPQCKKPFKHGDALKSHLKVIHGKII